MKRDPRRPRAPSPVRNRSSDGSRPPSGRSRLVHPRQASHGGGPRRQPGSVQDAASSVQAHGPGRALAPARSRRGPVARAAARGAARRRPDRRAVARGRPPAPRRRARGLALIGACLGLLAGGGAEAAHQRAADAAPAAATLCDHLSTGCCGRSAATTRAAPRRAPRGRSGQRRRRHGHRGRPRDGDERAPGARGRRLEGRRRPLSACSLLAASCAAAGCGGASDEDSIRGIVEEGSDPESICANLTARRSRTSAARRARSSPVPGQHDPPSKSSRGQRRQGDGEGHRQGRRPDISFVKEDGEWRSARVERRANLRTRFSPLASK